MPPNRGVSWRFSRDFLDTLSCLPMLGAGRCRFVSPALGADLGRGANPLDFRFGEFEIDLGQQELRRNGQPVRIEPQVFDLLAYLVRNRERIVSKDELIEAVWQGRIISDAALSSCVSAARRAIGDTGEDKRFIRTAPKRGFRFVGLVDDDASPKAGPAEDGTIARE